MSVDSMRKLECNKVPSITAKIQVREVRTQNRNVRAKAALTAKCQESAEWSFRGEMSSRGFAEVRSGEAEKRTCGQP